MAKVPGGGTAAAAAPATAAAAKRTRKSKAEQLVTLANKRVPRAIKSLNSVAALGKYQPSEAQAGKILEALKSAYEFVVSSLTTVQEKVTNGFTL
jgi:hypothetical protein